MTATKTLADLKAGDQALIMDCDGRLLGVGRIQRRSATEIVTQGDRRFKLGTAKEVGGNRFLFAATPEEIEEAESELIRRREEQQNAKEVVRQAAYDALPEEIKLTHKLQNFCEQNQDKVIAARLGIDRLRQIAAWLEKQP